MTDQTPLTIPTDGVVFAWGMTSSGEQREIKLEDIGQVIAEQTLSVWLHLNLSNTHVQRWLEKTSLVPDRVVELIKEGS